MRTLLAAATLAAVSLVPAAPATAAGTPGAGAVVIPLADFFRPTNGIVAVGSCQYAGAVLAAEAVSVTVLPGSEQYVQITCEIYDRFGNVVGRAAAGPQRYVAATATVVLPANTPVRICGYLAADGTNWGPVSGSSCAAVVPGELIIH